MSDTFEAEETKSAARFCGGPPLRVSARLRPVRHAPKRLIH